MTKKKNSTRMHPIRQKITEKQQQSLLHSTLAHQQTIHITFHLQSSPYSPMEFTTTTISFSLLLFLFSPSSASPSLTDRYIHRYSPLLQSPQQQYLDPTHPPSLPALAPCAVLPLFSHSFADTYGRPPFSAPYSPPLNCTSLYWSHILLSLSFSSSGDQYDRVAAVWLGPAEILRTSTAEPTEAGIFWRVLKDVTRYSSLFRRPHNISMMLENIVNDEFTGTYHVNASLYFYTQFCNDTTTSETETPIHADLVLPISNVNDSSSGFWFRVHSSSELHSANVRIPTNAYRAVLELYVSAHSNDEFWYSNPPDSYIKENNLTTRRGNGPFRQVCAMVDGRTVGSVVPFPVVFTGGINPLFWEPVVAIGAFDLPSYSLDVTPFLGLMLDGESHQIGLRVSDSISFWLVDANLHLWLDWESSSVTAELTRYEAVPVSVRLKSKFKNLNGSFKIKARSKHHFSGWVNSSFGNLTTDVTHKMKFKHSVVFLNDGNYKKVGMKAKMKMDVKKIKEGEESALSHKVQKYKFPLLCVTSVLAGENNTYTSTTNLSHAFFKETSTHSGERVVDSRILKDKQVANGWMLVEDHSVLSGSAGTEQVYQYNDNGTDCYTRTVSARDGLLILDLSTKECESDILKAVS
ncbi:peptide-N4-(N-acetyl-beta-glucosaminyl)asparagine amidase A-like [Iris pallida]|uniref:Peptide-N4-(N-acetyl-beta-glucosaminyl)asparagine amidase A-like n=1 Tax=Iris pallida TaxID=29817 RepID=A0AAX6G3B7_IRIPA|nr:peptide-N4-(N-acetyl-beta-glucosaminyl)asparagine amidase A-like [Iris pallida]